MNDERRYVSVTRKFEIDAAHRLPKHLGKCRNVHGHRYVFEVTLTGLTDHLRHDGMLADFGHVKKIIGDWLDINWDHGCLVAHDDDELYKFLKNAGSKYYVVQGAPTAEMLAITLYGISERLIRSIPNVKVARVRCYETPNCWADYSE